MLKYHRVHINDETSVKKRNNKYFNESNKSVCPVGQIQFPRVGTLEIPSRIEISALFWALHPLPKRTKDTAGEHGKHSGCSTEKHHRVPASYSDHCCVFRFGVWFFRLQFVDGMAVVIPICRGIPIAIYSIFMPSNLHLHLQVSGVQNPFLIPFHPGWLIKIPNWMIIPTLMASSKSPN